jgi:hypothetical protein
MMAYGIFLGFPKIVACALGVMAEACYDKHVKVVEVDK